MMNIGAAMKAKKAWETFSGNHPKLQPFLGAAAGQIEENSIIEVAITNAAGEKITTNMRITASDMELFRQRKEMM